MRSPLTRRRFSFLVAIGLVAACHGSSGGDGPFLAPGANDLGFAATSIAVGDGLLAATVDENGVDLNGDGDGLDLVLRVLDLADGRETTVPNVAAFARPAVGGGFVAFLVPEADEGRDLNGDGDTVDAELRVLDVRTGAVTSTALACEETPLQEGALFVFTVSEFMQGVDLDGDGLLRSHIAFVHDAERGSTTSLGIDVRPDSTRISDRRVLLIALESGGDLDGDGDRLDAVPFLYDADTGVLRNMERALGGDAQLHGPMLTLVVDEEASGQRDLNFNGRALDTFAEFYDLDAAPTPVRVTTSRSCSIEAADRDMALVTLHGSSGPGASFVFDRQSLAFLPVDVVTGFMDMSMSDRRFATCVFESALGTDVNGDGDHFDYVPMVFDARTGTMTPAGRVSASFPPPALGARHLVFLEQTPSFGFVLQVQDLDTGLVQDPGIPVDDFILDDERVLVRVNELLSGDLNGDGDPFDEVLEVHDLRTGRTLNTGVELFHGLHDPLHEIELALDGDVLVVRQPLLRVIAIRLP